MISREEIDNYVSMMNWAKAHQDISKISVSEKMGLYTIRSSHVDNTVAEGTGYSLSEAMEGYNKTLNGIELIRKTMQ
jgi:hypothetical protein